MSINMSDSFEDQLIQRLQNVPLKIVVDSLLPCRVEVLNGKTVAYSETGICVAEWGRELTKEEQVSYLTNPAQMWRRPTGGAK